MGHDPMVVVDCELRVHGTDNLRLLDTSIMPGIPAGDTCAAVLMIAEKAADLIRKS
jgi:choline dehydrogenase